MLLFLFIYLFLNELVNTYSTWNAQETKQPQHKNTESRCAQRAFCSPPLISPRLTW